MPIYFFDTSALLLRYADDPSFPKRERSRVRRIISNKRSTIFIAEITVLEAASGLAQICRRNQWGAKEFDAMDAAFFRDLATQRIRVRTVTQLDLLRVRHLLRFAGVLKKKKLKSADAVISECCRELALEKRRRIVFYVADWKLYAILRDIDAFRSTLKLRFLGEGKGSIPPET